MVSVWLKGVQLSSGPGLKQKKVKTVKKIIIIKKTTFGETGATQITCKITFFCNIIEYLIKFHTFFL